jgi:hypothetical protein
MSAIMSAVVLAAGSAAIGALALLAGRLLGTHVLWRGVARLVPGRVRWALVVGGAAASAGALAIMTGTMPGAVAGSGLPTWLFFGLCAASVTLGLAPEDLAGAPVAGTAQPREQAIDRKAA